MERHFQAISFVSLLLFFSCVKKTDHEKILETTSKVLTYIKDSSEDKFADLIAVDLDAFGKNKELLHYDFVKLHEYYKSYLGDKQVQPIIINSLNELGQKKVKLIFHKLTQNANSPEDIRLDLYFGPPNMFSFNKLSGYNITE